LPNRTTNVELLNRLRDVLGGRRVSRSTLDRTNYSHDLWPRSVLQTRHGVVERQPEMIVWPETTEEVSRVLKICGEMRVPVIPFGAGSGLCGAAAPVNGGVILDTKRMNKLERISEKSMIAVCQTGIIGAHLEHELNRHCYTMGHFPGSFGTSTLGGYLATRSAGQAATYYGRIEDMAISLQVVLADGTIVETRTVPRRATGPDFNHLFLGSEGTLGVITRARMRIHQMPEARAFRGLVFKDLKSGLTAMRKMLRFGLRPAVIRLSDEEDTSITIKALGINVMGCLLVLVFEGRQTQIDMEVRKAIELARAEGGRDHGEEPARLWFTNRFAESFRQSPILHNKGRLMDTVEVAATWSKLHGLYKTVRQAADKKLTLLANFSHAYPEGCSIVFTFMGQAENDLELYDRVWRTLLDAVLKGGGALSHQHGVGLLKAKWFVAQNPVAHAILCGLKRRLDPDNILNPGKLALSPEGPC